MRIFDDKGQNLIYDYDTSPYIFTSIIIIKELGVIIFGTNTGVLRVYLWPLDIMVK
jgi:hypothetical protein